VLYPNIRKKVCGKRISALDDGWTHNFDNTKWDIKILWDATAYRYITQVATSQADNLTVWRSESHGFFSLDQVAQPMSCRAEQSRAEQSRAEQSRAEQSRAAHTRVIGCMMYVILHFRNLHDSDAECDKWKAADECSLNPIWMIRNCKKSCKKCNAEDRIVLPPKRCENR